MAVIMDGNRRYAKREQLQQKIGYLKGFETIKRVSFIFIQFILPDFNYNLFIN